MTVRISTADFDIASEIHELTNDRLDIGAIVTFTGTVRGMTQAGKLLSMTLEHYPEMTEKELCRIEMLAHQRWSLTGSTIIHRVGTLLPGDNVVLVITSSAHRHSAFEAAEFLMDYLKTRAPFWKKETLADGTAIWVDAREADDVALARWQST